MLISMLNGVTSHDPSNICSNMSIKDMTKLLQVFMRVERMEIVQS